MNQRMPQYLHLPLKVLTCDEQEIGMFALTYVFFLILKGTATIPLLVGLVALIVFKRSKPRGYLVQLFYRGGFGDFKGYPPHAAETFRE